MEASESKISKSKFRTFQSFEYPAYRVYYFSMAGNWAALSMQMIVRALLAYRITESAALIGLLALAQSIPIITVSVFGGAIADRIQKKYILFIGRSGSVISSLGIAIALSLGYLSPGNPGSSALLIASAVLDGLVIGISQPALMSIIPEIVGVDAVMNAISLSNMGQTIFRLISPTLAGFLIDSYDFYAVYYFMSFMNFLSLAGTVFLPRSEDRPTGGKSTMENIRQAFSYIRRENIFLLIVIFAVCHMIGGMPHGQFLPVFTESILKVSATKMGILSSASGIGALMGSLILASLPNRKRGLLLILSGVIMALPIVIFSFSRSWYLSLSMMFIIGIAPTIHGTMTTTLIQSYADPDYRSRMQSFFAMAQGLAGFSAFLAGLLADAVGVQWAVSGMATFLGASSIIFWIFAAKLRNMD